MQTPQNAKIDPLQISRQFESLAMTQHGSFLENAKNENGDGASLLTFKRQTTEKDNCQHTYAKRSSPAWTSLESEVSNFSALMEKYDPTRHFLVVFRIPLTADDDMVWARLFCHGSGGASGYTAVSLDE